MGAYDTANTYVRKVVADQIECARDQRNEMAADGMDETAIRDAVDMSCRHACALGMVPPWLSEEWLVREVLSALGWKETR